MKEIADILLQEVFTRLTEQGITLEVTERFKDRLVEEGYSPSYGARPLRRAVTRLLEDSLVDEILSGRVTAGDIVTIDVGDDCQIQVLRSERLELLPSALA